MSVSHLPLQSRLTTTLFFPATLATIGLFKGWISIPNLSASYITLSGKPFHSLELIRGQLSHI